MPIGYFLDKATIRAHQTFVSPTVYFDQWALYKFSEDSKLQDEFVKTIIEKNGTLLISFMNLAEFSKTTDSKNAIDVENFLERLSNNVFIYDFVESMKAFKESSNSLPIEDLIFFKVLCKSTSGFNVKPTFKNLFKYIQRNRIHIKSKMEESGLHISQAFLDIKSSADKLKQTKRNTPDLKKPNTITIIQELLRPTILDANASLHPNDILDLQHIIIPICCCNYVLLDSAWKNRVKAIKQRLVKNDVHISLAELHSDQKDEILFFLKSLKDFSGV